MVVICTKQKKGYNHTDSSKQEHHNKIGGSSPKRTFLQHPAVLIRKNHIKKKVKPKRSKKQECSHQTPHLPLFQYQYRIEIQLKRRHNL